MLVSEQMSSPNPNDRMKELQELFKEEAFEFFGDIIGSATHPLKAAFELYVKMKEEEVGGDYYMPKDRLWCACGEHWVGASEHWQKNGFPSVEDCQACTTLKELREMGLEEGE